MIAYFALLVNKSATMQLMHILASHLPNMSILTYHEGQLIGRAGEPIIDPDRLEVVALHCRLLKSPHKTPVILLRDICEFDQDHLLIGSEEDVTDISDIIRISQLVARPFKVLGKPVVTQSGHRLGTSEDFTISGSSFQLQRLHVRRSILSSLAMGSLIIDRSQIIEVTPKRFIVRDAVAKPKVLSAPVATQALAE